MDTKVKLTPEQKIQIALTARNLKAVQKLQEKYAKQEPKQVIHIQNETEINPGTETPDLVDGTTDERPKETPGKVRY